ncbi:MAG: hypothetical protein AAFZ18_11020 [Myxococcota bacterium]
MQSFWVFLLGVVLVLSGVCVVLLKVGLEVEWVASTLLILAGISLAAGARLLRGGAGPGSDQDRQG